jgi:UDP-N-acetylmuramoylalanine--D-glutamate ligase
VAFGADRAQIVQGLAEFEIEQFDDLETAFNRAKETTQPGDILLLSPGCASFDEFPNYKARGNHFKNLVQHSSL